MKVLHWTNKTCRYDAIIFSLGGINCRISSYINAWNHKRHRISYWRWINRGFSIYTHHIIVAEEDRDLIKEVKKDTILKILLHFKDYHGLTIEDIGDVVL